MSTLAGKRAWLFDMDGTLTHAVHDFEAIKRTLGLRADLPILESLALLPAGEARDRHAELDRIEMDIAALAVAQPGAAELLDSLLGKGARIGIVTRNGKTIAHATLVACGLADYFPDATVVSRDCCTPKPHPAGVQLLLQRWNADARGAVMVGDYRIDLEAGRAAGVTTVHLDVSGTHAFPWCTDVCVQSLGALQALSDGGGNTSGVRGDADRLER